MTDETAVATPAISRILQRTQPWVRFMAILGFMTVGLMLIAAAGVGTVGVATENPQMVVVMFVYPLMALAYVFPSYYLLQYANRLRDFTARGEERQLEAALDAQRAFWKFVGILTIAGIVLTLMMFVAVIVAGIAAATGRSV